MIDASAPARSVILRLALPLYLPAFLISTGTGMLIPVLPLYLREVGLSYSLVTTVLAAMGFGAAVSQLPMGTAIRRWGEYSVMIAATVLIAASVMLLGVTAVTITLVALRVAAGIGTTGWFLSRHSFMTRAVPVEVRGRVSSTFGGVNRMAYLTGPILGGWVAARWGFDVAFLVTGGATALGVVPLLAAPVAADEAGARPAIERRQQLRELIRKHRSTLAPAGAVQLGVVAAREGRHAVIPLLGAALGLDVASVGWLVAIGAASDLILFPAAGQLMDRLGRLAAVVPSLTLFGVGLLIAAAASGPTVLMVGAGVVGLGNGLGAGTMLTIGSDLAPTDDPSRFLSVLGATRDAGRVLGPLLVGWMADLLGLGASAVVLSVVAFATAGFMAAVLGDTRRYARDADRPV